MSKVATESVLRKEVSECFFDFNQPFEGVVSFLYADVRNFITIGVGNLVDPLSLALALPLRRPDGSLASVEEIEADWRAVKSHPDAARFGANLAKKIAKLRMTEEDIRSLVARRLDATVADLARRYPGLPGWPADAQLGICSMAWAMGPGFEGTHPKCAAALRAGRWLEVVRECKISEVGNPGVAPRNLANRRLFLASQRVIDDGLDPAELTPAAVTLAELEARYLASDADRASPSPDPEQTWRDEAQRAWGMQIPITPETNPDR